MASDHPLRPKLAAAEIQSLAECIVLPPKVPQKREEDPVASQAVILELWQQGMSTYTETSNPMNQFKASRRFAETTQTLNSAKYPDAEDIAAALRRLQKGDGFVLFLQEQNCAILFHRAEESTIDLEMFEISAENSSTMSAVGPVERILPGVALRVPMSFLLHGQAIDEFSRTLAELAAQKIPEFLPLTRKAGKDCTEIRDTISPSAVTQALAAILLSHSHTITVDQSVKRVYDEVCWEQCLEPWRRPPIWFVLRAATQRWMQRCLGFEHGLCCYKNLQIIILSDLCFLISSKETLEHILFFARAKLARRLEKLRATKRLDTGVDHYARKILVSCNVNSHAHWQRFQHNKRRTIPPIPNANTRDTRLRLNNSASRIAKELIPIEVSTDSPYTGPALSLARQPRSVNKVQQVDFPSDEHACMVALYDFEQHMRYLDCELTLANFRALEIMIHKYGEASNILYANNIDCSSMRLLTMMEAWTQLDKIAISLEPLTNQLSPNIPPDFMRHLRLLCRDELQRVARIEAYLEQRRSQANKYHCPFSDSGIKDFAGAYYSNEVYGKELRDMCERVQRDLQNQLDEKCAEWITKRDQVNTLQQQANRTSHERYIDRWNSRYCYSSCALCSLRADIRRVTIVPLEEPLPRDKRKQQWVLFELLCPEVIQTWRDITWKITTDLGRPESQRQSEKISCQLSSYGNFSKYWNHRWGRITIASSAKAFNVSHYGRERHVADIDFSDVHLTHGPQWFLLDSESDLATEGELGVEPELVWKYQGLLPETDLYSSSSDAILSVKHSSNEVVAWRSRCPPLMSMFEFNSFNVLRSGESLQWLNIIAELASPNLQLSNAPTQWLILQAALEIGTSDPDKDILRQAHRCFRNQAFCEKLLGLLQRQVSEAKANWREHVRLYTLLILILRLEEISPTDFALQSSCRDLRADIREASRVWTRQLRGDLDKAEDQASKKLLHFIRLSAALLCRATYTYVDTARSVTWDAYFECGFLVANETPTKLHGIAAPEIKHLTLHDWHNACKLEGCAVDAAKSHPEQLCAAVDSVWPSGQEFERWVTLDEPNSRWLQSRTKVCDGKLSRMVHVNVLTGELLIDGDPPGRLPKTWLQTPQYIELFGSKKPETRPSPMQGMNFLAELNGCIVHFGWDNHGIRICREMKPNLDLFLPRQVFASHTGLPDLPQPLIDYHVHWLRIVGERTGSVHICPQRRLFEAAGTNDWILHFSERLASRRSCNMLDPGSKAVQTLSNTLGSFESRTNLVANLNPDGETVVWLPRFGLTFDLTSLGSLFCRDMSSVLLKSQDPETFIGLSGHLLMQDQRTGQEVVIVPHGQIRCVWDQYHVQTSISTSGQRHVSLARYTLNKDLKRLDCSADPRDMLLKAYLHAVTSGLLPDPLTGHRGTEEAIQILNELHRQMYEPLSAELQNQLDNIAGLTPVRVYYPEGKSVMQTSAWKSYLPPSSQIDDFREAVEKLIQRSNEIGSFHDQSQFVTLKLSHDGDATLHNRACERNSKFYPRREGVGVSKAAAKYEDRGKLTSNSSTERTLEIANLIKQWAPDDTSHDLNSVLDGSSRIGGFHHAFPPSSVPQLFSFNIVPDFGSLLQTCRQATREADQMRFLFLFPFLAFSSKVVSSKTVQALKLLLSVAAHPEHQTLFTNIPSWSFYADFNLYESPNAKFIDGELTHTDVQPDAPEIYQNAGEGLDDFEIRRKRHIASYESALVSEVTRAQKDILHQWPCAQVSRPNMQFQRTRFDRARLSIQTHWDRLWQNRELSRFFTSLCDALNASKGTVSWNRVLAVVGSRPLLVPRPANDQKIPDVLLDALEKVQWKSTLAGLTLADESCDLSSLSQPERRSDCPTPRNAKLALLGSILDDDRFAQDQTRRGFVDDHKLSLDALRGSLKDDAHSSGKPGLIVETLQAQLDASERKQMHQLSSIITAIQQHPSFQHLNLGGLWPRTTLVDLLQLLASRSKTSMSSRVQAKLRNLALQLVKTQRIKRIEFHYRQKDQVKLTDELINKAHSWDVEAYPEWLVLEIEMNACIRPEQARMALEMSKPPGHANSIYQLQMGKGKSSLIIPMLASILSDGHNLTRIVVPKPLLVQMGAILKQRLCRLLGRPLLHIPFDRSTMKNGLSLAVFERLHEEILHGYGAVLALPEHMQSFGLSGTQRILDGEIDQGQCHIETARWLESHTRDVLDECDHILSPRTQLIYPSGNQTPIDGGDRRWKMIARLLLNAVPSVRKYAEDHPDEVQVEVLNADSFPLIHIQSAEAGVQLMGFLVDDLSREGNSLLQIGRLSSTEAELLRSSLKNGPLSSTTMKMIDDRLQDELDVNDFLILRGLLGGGILMLTLQKRWNVQYGLDLRRCHIAVPYIARGRPSLASEYGHPDVALVLTYLAYYYNGLQLWQLRNAIEKLQLEQDPDLQWDDWVKYAHAMPDDLRSWKAVNIDDARMMHQLWKSLCRSLATVNYYLDKIVFPHAAREFERKLVSSSWDIPLRPPRLTTGFSGTNDNSKLLPDSIRSQFVDEHGKANAEVLWHLLQERNSEYRCTVDKDGRTLSVHGILALVTEMKVCVLLDAGALILEMGNAEVADHWLNLRTDAAAVAYFNETGSLAVRQRNGQVDLLSKSRYAKNLDDCLLYLDEEHCRGTDTKLSSHARAALTIGPRQQKDQTVQAAMRMRQLAHDQSVVFLAAPPVDKNIRSFNGLSCRAKIDSSHVIKWSIEQSCVYITSHLSLWESQRRSFVKRRDHMDQLFAAPQDDLAELASLVPEPEKRSLRQLYGPGGIAGDLEATYTIESADQTNTRAGNVISLASAEEEQERQVDQEVQEEQQRQRPGNDKPLIHKLHEDVEAFVLEGTVDNSSLAYRPTFRCMARTQALRDVQSTLDLDLPTESSVLVTEDFFMSVKNLASSFKDHAQKMVRFIVWNARQPNYLMIISPFEANILVPEIEKSQQAHLLLFEAPRTKDMVTRFEGLRFLGYPRLPPANAISQRSYLELLLFAGGTFFSWNIRSDVIDYMRSLNGVLHLADARRSDSDMGVGIVRCMRYWYQIRMHGIGFELSPMGYLLDDRNALPTDAIFAQ